MVMVKRTIAAFGCAAAFVAAPLVAASPAVAKECPYGTSARSEGVCTAGGPAMQGGPVIPPQASPPGPVISSSPGGIGSVNGIPCTPEHYGTCIAMQQANGG
jgi:hypothetical protein